MSTRNERDSSDRIQDLPASASPTCRLVGHVCMERDDSIRLYPTSDKGLWLEIDARDVIEIVAGENRTQPSTIVIAEQAPITLRMDVTASVAATLVATAASERVPRTRTDWRTSLRHRLQAGTAGPPFATRKLPSSVN